MRMDARAKKISETMRARSLDNFKQWRDLQKAEGKVKSSYPALKKDGDLAELIGTVLGDGHIYKHARCESLRIVGDAKKMGFVNHSAQLMYAVFRKQPKIARRRSSNGVNITMYEKNISKRLALPTGSRARYQFILPDWIEKREAYKIRFLRGLYEAEGSISHSPATYTHKFQFGNTNPHLLSPVARLVAELGFTQNTYKNKVQVSRGEEVQKLANLLQFRNYSS